MRDTGTTLILYDGSLKGRSPVAETFRLSYADAEEVADSLESIYPDRHIAWNGGANSVIFSGSAEELMQEMLPKVLRMKMFTVLLDSNAAEHAARTMAMQIATDNANELLQELTVMYNKSRQQSITNELLDIVGGSMA